MITRFVLLCCIFFGGCDNDIYRHLANNYYYISLGGDSSIIGNPSVKGEVVVPCKIESYDFDEVFIIAVNKQVEKCAWRIKRLDLNSAQFQYWIIKTDDDEVHGPLTREEYIAIRNQLKIPDNLRLKEQYEKP